MIEVVQPGAYTSVQGDRAWRRAHFGIPLGGPADAYSHACANRLVGNPARSRALEITLLGPALLFHHPAVVALFGAPFDATIPLGEPVSVTAGETVAVRGTAAGSRCYLAVAGGVEAPDGAVLAKGQRISGGLPRAQAELLRFRLPRLASPAILRYTAPEPRPDLVFTVTNDVNRRGIRLHGSPLAANREIITEGVNAGTIQVPPNGQPLILFYDQTTTGGYPKLGTIVRPDLDRVGQLRPRDTVILRRVSFDEPVD